MSGPRLRMLVALVVMLAACGGGDGDSGPAETPITAAETQATDRTTVAPSGSELQETADALTENLQEVQDAQGGGSATLTVGDRSWTFDNVLSAFGEAEIGQAGAEFVLSSIQDGFQLYASIDSFGQSVTLNDIEDFQNPSVSLTAGSFTTAITGGPEEFIEVNGKEIRAGAPFVDDLADSSDGIDGTLEATCP